MASQAAESGVGPDREARARPRAIAAWLWFVAALVVGIVVVGGITRLTESGVSITEWKPVTGVIPPLSHAQWQAEFDAYRLTPQFQQINGPAGMTLASYKFIYFWEWLHRLVARAIGTVLALVIAWFWVKRAIPQGYKPRLLGLLVLVGVQGAVGWWMVESGIQYDVKVSHLRLATHLLLALTTLAGLTWTALDLRGQTRGEAPARLTGFAALALAMLALQLAYGALVAGLRAGYVARDWPTMNGDWFPRGVDWSQGVGHAMLFDPFLTYFIHRWWAWAVVAVLVVMGRKLRQRGLRSPSVAVHAAFGTQIVLGVATVMSGIALWIAVLHQLNAALLLIATVWGGHALGRRTA